MQETHKEILEGRIYSNLRSLRDDYSDEVPPEELHSTDEDNKYKVRIAWWAALGGNLRLGLHNEIFPAEKAAEIRQFLDRPVNIQEAHKKGFLSSAEEAVEDIKAANTIIDLIIGEKK